MPLITISCLGSKGRSGNSFFQWAFARGYAKAVGADLQTPDWFGRRIFHEAAAEPLIDRVLPKTHCDSVCLQMGLPLGYFFGKTDIDLVGYFQHAFFLDYYSVKRARRWFRFKPEFESLSSPPHNAVAHYRRGDYSADPVFQKLYCTVSDASYERAFAQFNCSPVTAIFDGCGTAIPQETVDAGVPWLMDFLAVRDAPVRFRSNSTFAWWACTLGGGIVYAPLVEKKVGLQDIPFVIGNWPNTAGVFPNQSDLDLNIE